MKTYKTNEIISLLLDKSKKNGATDTEVIISKSYGKSLEVRNNVKEKIEEFDTFNIGIRVSICRPELHFYCIKSSIINIIN